MPEPGWTPVFPLRSVLARFYFLLLFLNHCFKSAHRNVGISLLDQAKYLAPVSFQSWPTPVFNYSSFGGMFPFLGSGSVAGHSHPFHPGAVTFLLSANFCHGWFLICLCLFCFLFRATWTTVDSCVRGLEVLMADVLLLTTFNGTLYFTGQKTHVTIV